MTAARRLAVPAISTVVMLVLLIALGNWQVRRLAWKEGLLAQIDAAEVAAPVPLGVDPSPFAKVELRGVLRGDLAVLYASEVRDTARGTRIGAQLVEPLQRADGGFVLVDLGWVPTDAVVPVSGAADVAGFVHPAESAGWGSARDDVAGRHFYTLDPPVIAAALGLRNVAPFTLVVMGKPIGQGAVGDGPIPAQHLPRPPDDHLSYAITWYGLAVTLLVIFAVYSWKVLRR